MAFESRKALACLSAFLLLAIVGVTVFVVLYAEKHKDIEELEDKLTKCETGEDDNGFDPQTSQVKWDSCDDISIIGAGIGGSYAGYRLRDLGKKITIYEYSDRIGGRCYTGKLTGVPDVNLEYGAMRFYPGIHKLLNQSIHDLGLTVLNYAPPTGPFQDSNAYLRGHHVKYGDIPNEDLPYYLPDTFRGKTLGEINWELFRDNTNVDPNVDGYLNDLFNLKSADGVELWKQSRHDFYMKYLHVDTAKYLQDINVWDNTFHNSTAALRIPTSPPSQGTSQPLQSMASGFQSIPETMMVKFLNSSARHSFMRNHQLLSIRKNETNGKYVLVFQPTETTMGKTQPVREGHYLPWKPRYICARKVILAVGRLALEQIDWEGLRKPEIRDYITNSLDDIQSTKLYLAFDKAWWQNSSLQDRRNPHYSLSDTPLRQTFEYRVSASTNIAVLNAAYTDWNQNTNFWRQINNIGVKYPGTTDASVSTTSEVVRYAMRFLSEIYNVSVTDLYEPVYAAMQLWDSYPYGAGWYRWRPGYNWNEVASKMLRPSASDDVFVACSAFSSTDRSSWTEGALEIVDYILKYFIP